MSCGADSLAKTLLDSLLEGKRFDLPDTDLNDDLFQIPKEEGDLYQDIKKLTNEDLTTRVVDGSGVFDALMSGLSAHLRKEYEQNRITGAEYTKAYIEAMQGALDKGTAFLLERDQAYWQALLVQQQARLIQVQVVTARVQLEVAKAQLAEARIRVLNAEADYGLTKMKIATEDQQYCLLQEQTTQTIAQTALVGAQTIQTNTQTTHIEAETVQTTTQTNLIERQIDAAQFTNQFLLPAQHEGLQLDNNTKSYNLNNILPAQYKGLELDNDTKTFTLNNILPAQETLIKEQAEAQRAATHDTRLDGDPVRGSVGKQKDLYTQQIESYKRDAEIKAAKLFTDAWITQKTIDELTPAPGSFRMDSYNAILRNIKANNNLDNDPGAQDGDPND